MTEQQMKETLCMMALANEMLKDSRPMEPELAQLINDHFWELLEKNELRKAPDS
jgi:hypothetical protein